MSQIRILSPVKEIEALVFKPMPTKTIAITKLVRTDRTIIALTKKGELLVSSVLFDCLPAAFMFPSDGYTTRSLISCAVKMGVITKTMANKHWKASKEATQERDRISEGKRFIAQASKLGIALNADQIEHLQ